jgi:Na+/proline symporter
VNPLDLAVNAGYIVLTHGVGMGVSRRQSTTGDYVLRARDQPAWGIMLSIVATETSALTVNSVPGVGARGDLTIQQNAY